MVFHCVAVGCRSRQKKGSGVHFYRFPADKERCERWVAAMNRENWVPTVYSRLCSKHFISGEKSENPRCADYVPSIFSFEGKPGKKRKQLKDIKRLDTGTDHTNIQQENDDRSIAANSLLDLFSNGNHSPSTRCDTEDVSHHESTKHFLDDAETNSKPDIVQCKMPSLLKEKQVEGSDDPAALKAQCKALQAEVLALRKKVNDLSLTKKSFEGDDKKVEFYTGLTSFSVLMGVHSYIEKNISRIDGLTKFQQLLMSLMKRHLNLTTQDLAYRFGVETLAVTRTLQNVGNICRALVVPGLTSHAMDTEQND